MFLFKVISIVMMVLLSCLGISSASLVTNGGFEDGTYGVTVTEGTTTYTYQVPVDWTHQYNSISSQLGVRNNSYSLDNYYVSFYNEGGTGTLSQQISTISGQAYQVSFWLYNTSNLWGYPGNGGFSFTWGNDILFNLIAPPNFGWTFFTFTALADSSITNLALTGHNEPGAFWLDNVSVNPVPLPPSMLLFGSGLVGLASYVRYERKRSRQN
jgi:hypothetical protein